MSDIIGHDIDGRPLRVGDEVLVISCEDRDLAYMVGDVYAVTGVDDAGELVIDAVSYDGWEVGVYPRNIRKLDNHHPATESFTEIMSKFKGVRV